MDSRRLREILIRFQASFLAAFPALTIQDLQMIVTGPRESETLLDRLQMRYGYTRAEAKAAWNDFVLVHVDGHGENPLYATDMAGPGVEAALTAGRWVDPRLWRLLCLGWGRPSAHRPGVWLGYHHPGTRH
jgi:hypothetical protein